jgi:hypothetical protein
LGLVDAPDVVQALATDAAGKMGMKLSRGVSGAADQSLRCLGGLAPDQGGRSVLVVLGHY